MKTLEYKGQLSDRSIMLGKIFRLAEEGKCKRVKKMKKRHLVTSGEWAEFVDYAFFGSKRGAR